MYEAEWLMTLATLGLGVAYAVQHWLQQRHPHAIGAPEPKSSSSPTGGEAQRAQQPTPPLHPSLIAKSPVAETPLGIRRRKQVTMALDRNEEISPEGTKRAVSSPAMGDGAAALGTPRTLAPETPTTDDENSVNPVLHAIKSGRPSHAIQMLLSMGAALPKPSASGRTVLHDCAEVLKRGQEDIIPSLVREYKVPLAAADRQNAGLTALHLACAVGASEVASKFMALAAEDHVLDVVNDAQWTCLHIAAARNRADLVTAALKLGANSNSRNTHGSTPLHLACMAKAHAAAIALLKDPSTAAGLADGNGMLPLHMAVMAGYEACPVIELLLARGDVKPNAPDSRGNTPLHLALQKGHGRVSLFLLQHGADIDARNHQGVTPLHLVASADDTTMLGHLLQASPMADINLPDQSGRSPLMVAAMKGASHTAAALMAKGGDPTRVSPVDRQDALGWALTQRHRDVAMVLLRHYSEASAGTIATLAAHRGPDGSTALQLACEAGADFASVAEILVDARPQDANVPPPGRASNPRLGPLHLAAKFGSVKLVTSLLEAGADQESVTADGALPLHLAAEAGQFDVVEMLLALQPSLAAVRDRLGLTPLERATQCLASAHDGESVTPAHASVSWLERTVKIFKEKASIPSEVRAGGDAPSAV